MDYNYTRELEPDGRYNIGYSGEKVSLAKEIKETFPTRTINVQCHGTAIVISMAPDLDAGEKTTLDTIISDRKANIDPVISVYKITGGFEDPTSLNINLFGLHKEELIDSFGLLATVNYYKNYDGTTYSDLVAKDEYVYNINVYDLVDHRTETLTWYLEDDTVGKTKTIEKYYDTIAGIDEGMKRRNNLIEKAKAYGMSSITGTHEVTGDPVVPNSHWFFMQIAGAVDLYIQGINKQGLIDDIQGSGETYLTQTIKDTIEGILKYW